MDRTNKYWAKKYSQEHIYSFSILLTLISMMLLYTFTFWIYGPINWLNYSIIHTFISSVPMLFIIGICYHSGNIRSLKLNDDNNGRTFLLGWLIIAYGLYGFISAYINFDRKSLSIPDVEKFICFTIVIIMISVFRETLCQCIMLNSMMNKWGHTKSGIIKSVIISSLIFGLGYFVNLIGSPTLIIKTLTQAVCAFLIGIMFAGIYLRCKNIWALIFLNTVYEWLNQVITIYRKLPVPMQIDTPAASALITCMMYIPFALIGFFLINKVLPKDTCQYKSI